MIGDRAYISNILPLDLFEQYHIKLRVPFRINQYDYKKHPKKYRSKRQMIETVFAQLCDQFMLKRNYTKTLLGLSVRVLCKITSATCLQYLNSLSNKPINHLKFALAC